jgi:hypothetical protein
MRIARAIVVFLPLLLSACLSQPSAPATAPANFTVTAGENRAVLTWDSQPGLTYWVYFKAGSSVSTSTHDYIKNGIASPYVVSGLANGTQYAFIINASDNGSKTGPTTPVVTATPRLLGPGVPWTVATPLTGNALNDIAFNGNHFVAVGDGATLFSAPYSYTATGGVSSWSPASALPSGFSADLSAVVYDGSRFIALGVDGSTMLSTDTLNWTAGTAIAGAPALHAMAYGAGPVYVAVGDGGAIYRNSGGGLSGAWVAETSGTSQDLYGVSYVNGQFVAVGAAGALLTSPDGAAWTVRTSSTNNSLRHVAYGAATYVAVGDAGTIVSSSDAVNWTAQSIPTTQSFYSICFGPDAQFIAVGTVGTLAYSSSGADGSWSVANAGSMDLYSIVPGDVFIAVGAAGANVSGK